MYHNHQLTLSTASTHVYLSSLHSQDYRCIPQCSICFECASLQIVHHLVTLHDSSNVRYAFQILKVLSWSPHKWSLNTCHASHLSASTLTVSRSTTTLYCCYMTRSWPPTVSPKWINHGLQVYLWVHTIIVSKWSCEFSWSQSACVLQYPLDPCLHVHHGVSLISDFNCISKLAPSKYTTKWVNCLGLGLQVHLGTCSIMATESILKSS